MKHKELAFEFVENIPENAKDGILYISTKYATAIHKCCCGCGNEVVTPLSPAQWSLTFDGDSVSLDPSIGNWNFPCRSHYWITRNKVRSAPAWSKRKIDSGRLREQERMERYFDSLENHEGGKPNRNKRSP